MNIHEEYATIGDTSYCDQDINELQDDNHSTNYFDIVSNASTDIGCHEDEIVPFGNPKDNEQIFISACDRFEYASDSKGSPQFSDLQTKEECNRYEEEDDDLKSPDQQFIMHSSQSEVEQYTVNMETIESSQQQHFIQLEQQHGEVFLCDIYDPISDYLESISNINVKIFLSDDSWLCNPFKLHCCMLWFHLFFGSRSRTSSADQFLTWLHWKHDVT